MNNKNKGISMISLIVIIVSIIIFSGIAITAGYRYITEGQEAQKAALINIISEAAYRRQNDSTINSKSYYAGSLVRDESQITPSNFKNLPSSDELSELENKLNGENPIWFVLDGESVEDLGISSSTIDTYKKYIVDKLDDINTSDETHYSPVALVEYITGSTYLVEMKNSAKDSIIVDQPTDHPHHVWAVATCFKPKECIICGATDGNKLEHDIVGAVQEDGTITATCTQAKMCRRCGTVFEAAKGHKFNEDLNDRDAYAYDAVNHWLECLNGCGTKTKIEAHTKSIESVDDNIHKEECYICRWKSGDVKHNIVLESIDDTHHRRYCTDCNYDVTHQDEGWKYSDKNSHWRKCNICGEVLFKQDHVDDNNDSVCDICNRPIDYIAPRAFDAGDIALVSKSTHQIEISAKTEDNEGGLGLSRYEFSIDNGNTWNVVTVSDDSQVAIWKYNNLAQNTSYTITVRAIDKEDNYVRGQITASTYQVPNVEANSSLSNTDPWTKDDVRITLSMPNVGLPSNALNELKFVYRLEGSSDEWLDYNTTLNYINISEEDTTVYVKIVDKKKPVANSSSVIKTIAINNIDKTAPSVVIEAPIIDEYRTSRTATLRVSDTKSGLAKDSVIYYAWTTSTTAPSTYSQSVTVPSKSAEFSVDLITPERVEGRYYLWIKEGVEDDVGNKTTEPVRSPMYFNIDDIEPELTITMRNKEADVVDELFVRTGKNITVNMTSTKRLSRGPLVQIITAAGTKSVRATSSDETNWVATITADAGLTEGLLNNVKISDFVSYSGKAGGEYTSTSDGKYVTYDKTLPQLQYINK